VRLATALLVGIALAASASIAVAQKSPAAPPGPGFEYLGTLQVQTGTRTVVENGPQGTRTIVQINGGRFDGPRLKASVQTPAGDWITNRADGSYRLDVRMTLKTDDGALILATYNGVNVHPLLIFSHERHALSLIMVKGRDPGMSYSVTF